MYKLKKLIEENVDFSEIYPQKQMSVRENTGLDFDLAGIVLFLQKQTNNFTIDNTIAKDLDDAIFKIVEQWRSEQKPDAEPAPEPTPEPVPSDDDSSEKDAIMAMLFIDVEEGEKEAIESMLHIVDKPADFLESILNQNADFDKKKKKYVAKSDAMLSQQNIDYLAGIVENYKEPA